MCQRNIQCIQYKNCVYFHCLPPYFKDSREMQGEQILWGLRCLFFTRACQVDHLCSWLCSNFPCFKPLPLRKCTSSLRLRLFYCLSFFILSHSFERRRTCSYCYLSVPFLPFSYTMFYTFLQLCIPFYSLLVLFLYSHLYAHFFHRPQLYSSARFIRRDYLLVCFSFHPSQPCTASSFLPLIYLLTPPVYLSCLFCPV